MHLIFLYLGHLIFICSAEVTLSGTSPDCCVRFDCCREVRRVMMSVFTIFVLQTAEAFIACVVKEVNSKGSFQDHVRQPAGAQMSGD